MRLVVEAGPNRGALYALGAVATLGRGEGCELQLLDDGVSRQHARIERQGARYVLRDLESRNGTRLNGVPVDEAELLVGDRVAIGGVRLRALPEPAGGEEPAAGPQGGATRELSLEPQPLPGAIEGEEAWIGEDPRVAELLRRVARAAPAEASCLVLGETGTGKELVARALHDLSPRRRGPFLAVNCGALPAELIESELFGHERGAFTGAVARKVGLVEAASTGTLFLDEVGELPPPAQAKLLRFLERKELLRVGSTTPRRVDVRVVAATHRDLDAMAQHGELREDLLHRLRVVELHVPPLRERGRDVELLANHFLSRLGAGRLRSFSAPALAALRVYPWPGNVRELKNVLEGALIFAEGEELTLLDLPPRIRHSASDTPPPRPSGPPRPLADLEREAIVDALAFHDGQKTRAADALGIDRKTLYNKIRAYGLE
ncbi:MAG: sigma 54-interacting transcriptional regulator [Planctomycetota bacterium]